jgi:uncharacterized protein YgbK (DUF1537 family)
MKTIVIDDDPTGTQSATGVRVLFECSEELLVNALANADSVYVQTNSRSIPQAEAVELLTTIKRQGLAAGVSLGAPIEFVLRGDSTLRGHVFAETEVFLGDDAVMLFVPAFPDGGRITRGGVHYVRVDGVSLPADESEFADDPVFGFSTAVLVDYVAQKSGRAAISVSLDEIRAGRLQAILAEAPRGSVVVPDAETNEDVREIARGFRAAVDAGRNVIVRCAAPLAAVIARVESAGLLSLPLVHPGRPTLLVCGSHTGAATEQLEAVSERWGAPHLIETDLALDDPSAAAAAVVPGLVTDLGHQQLAVVSSERLRSKSHNTLSHGQRIMEALTAVVRSLVPMVEVIVSKGGITSSEVARVGLGAKDGWVLGQILPGVSVWNLRAFDGQEIVYVVVPGNVGERDALVRVLAALSLHGGS